MNDSAGYSDSTPSDMEMIGIVFGQVGSYEFNFAVAGAVERNEYVQLHHDSYGWMLARVDEVRLKTDLTSDGALRVAKGEQVEFSGEEIAHSSMIGFADGRGGIAQPRQPVLAGTKVFRATDEVIAAVLGLSDDRAECAYVGNLHGRSLPVHLSIEAMIQRHISIVAKTGGGKSYLAGVLLEEMLKHSVTTLILDPHGEYRTLGETADGKGVESEFRRDIIEFAIDTEVNKTAVPLRFTLSNFTAPELLSLTTLKENRSALTVLSACLEKSKESSDYTLRGLLEQMDQVENPVAMQLKKELEALETLNLFAEKGTRTDELATQGKTTIVNFKGATPEVQGLFVKRLLTALFELRKRDKIPPLLVVLEEAHNFCPQQGKTDASRIIRTVAAEGRKFGIGLLVITQRAAKVDKNVLSQCNTQFILKLTNGNDLKAVASSVEGMTSEMMDEIPRLTTGVTIAVGGGLPVPLIVDVRRRETRHGGDSVSIIWRQ